MYMKTRTKLLTVIVFSFTVFSAQAQSIRAGVNLANVTITNDGDIDDNKMLTSFQVGVSGDVFITKHFFFQPGIYLTGKGSKTQSGSTTDATYFRATSNPYYVEIPANFVFKTDPLPVKFFAGAGPYIAMGVAGKNKVDGKFLGTSFSSEENIKWSNDDPSTFDYEEGAGYGIMKRFDYGVNILSGIETRGAVFSVNYGLGLAKLQSGSNSSADDKNKHRVLSFVVGIKL